MNAQRKISWTRIFTGMVLSTLAAANAVGQTTVDTLVGQSDMVFQGVVEGIEYRMSMPGGPEGTSVPYTFVKYRVTNVIRGEAEDEITLRFIGGLDEQSGLYLRASNAPQFDVGDEDILFVQGNTERLVPLVADEVGRLRVIGGQIYDENAHSINIADDGTLIPGSRYLLEQAMTTTVKGRVMVREMGPRAIDGASDAMLTADLLPQLVASARVVPEPLFKFVSADPTMPVDAPDMTPAAPPAVPAGDQAVMGEGNPGNERAEVQDAKPVQRDNK